MNHKRISRLWILLVLAMLAVLVSSVPAFARAERVYYTGEECPITLSAPERQWISDDGVLHQRGIAGVNITTSDSPYLTGVNYLVANYEFNLVTGAVHGYGTVELHPDAYDGTWMGHWSTHVSPEGVIRGTTTLQGSGELDGLIIFNTMSNPSAPNPTCNNINTTDTGYILFP